MPIVTRWYSPDKIRIYTKLEDPWTLEEFIDSRKKWYRLIKSVDYIVPILIDFSSTFDTPDGILHHFLAIHRTPHPRQGPIVVFGINPRYKKLSIHLFASSPYPMRPIKVVSSLDEALSIGTPIKVN